MKSIPNELERKLKKNAWTAENDCQPEMEILLTKPRSAITDTDYFVIETIRHRPELSDIAIAPRRLKIEDEQPDRLYEVHIEAGKVETAYKEYPDELEQGWKTGKIIEPGSAVAIAFDGEWKRQGKRWRLITEEEPYLFFRNAHNNLICQKWHDETTKIELAKGIVKLKAIRAWKSSIEIGDDNGIIVAYTKSNNKLYYRNLAVQNDGQKIWEGEREIPTEYEVSEFNLFLTNDYRTGIIAKDTSNALHYIISKRNWAGMGIEAEYIKCYTDLTVNFIKINEKNANYYDYVNATTNVTHYLGYTGTDNEILYAGNIKNDEGDYGRIVEVKTKHDIRLSNEEDWVLVDEKGKNYTALTYSGNFGNLHTIRFLNFNNTIGELTIKYKGLHGCNAIDNKYSPMSHSFTPTNLNPESVNLIKIIPILTNEGAYTLLCTFAQELINDENLKQALKVKSESYIDNRKTSTITSTHEIESAVIENSNTIIITLTETGRLKSAKTIEVNYDDTVGNIQNTNGDVIASFLAIAETSEFNYISDIYCAEYIKTTTSINADLIYINTKEMTSREFINVKTDLTIDFIDISNINP